MSSEYIEASIRALLTDNCCSEALAFDRAVHLITGLESILGRDIHKTEFFGRCHGILGKLSLCLGTVQESLIFFGKSHCSSNIVVAGYLILIREFRKELLGLCFLGFFLFCHISHL